MKQYDQSTARSRVFSIALVMLMATVLGGDLLFAAGDARAAAAAAGVKVSPSVLKGVGDPFKLVLPKAQETRYVRFKIHSNFGEDKFGNCVGLNEVQFFSVGRRLTGSVAAKAGSEFSPEQAAARTVDGSGVSDRKPSTDYQDMWCSATNDVAGAWIQFDLGSQRLLDTIKIWNYNQIWQGHVLSNRGVKQADVQLSNDGAAWQTICQNLLFPTGAPPAPPPEVKAVDLPGPILFLKGISPQISYERTVGSPSRVLNIERDSSGAAVAGNALYVLDATGPDVQPRLLFDAGTGWIGYPFSVSYDGKTVYFCMATQDDPFYHIFSLPLSGGQPRQLTRGSFHDCDPEALPGGGVLFSSTRLGTREEYHSYPTTCLMTMRADGSQIRPFTYHIVHDRFPRMTRAGDVVCVRQDNFLCNSKIITNIEFLRRTGEGAYVLLGQERGPSGYNPMSDAESDPYGVGRLKRTTLNYKRVGQMFGCPAALPDGKVACLSSVTVAGVYPNKGRIDITISGEGSSEGQIVTPSLPVHDISALPDGRLLCATLDRKYLGVVDVSSGKVTVFHSGAIIHGPVFAGRRPEPAPWNLEAPERENRNATGTFFCQNIFKTHQKYADLRRIRAIRVYESRPFTIQSCSYIDRRGDAPSGPHIGTEAIELGAVPIAANGSFLIEVPADRPLAFQAVDGEGHAVVSELSWLYVRPGERRSCVGCHSPRDGAPSTVTARASVRPLRMEAGPDPYRWKVDSFKHGGVVGYQSERIRESKSVNLYPWPDPLGAVDDKPLAPGCAGTMQNLLEQVKTGLPAQRISALRRLILLHDRSTTPALVAAVQDGDSRIRLEAALALAACGDHSALAPLAAQLAKEDDAHAVTAIENALGHLTGERRNGAKAWQEWLSQNDHDQMARALAGRIAATNDHQDIIMLVQALGHLGGEPAKAALRDVAAKNGAVNARLEAMLALARLKDTAALPVLTKILAENNLGADASVLNILLFSGAAQALGLFGGAEAEKALLDAIPKLALFGKYNVRLGDQAVWCDFSSYAWPYFRMLEAFDTLGTRLPKSHVLRLIGGLHHSFDQAMLLEYDSYETMLVRVVQRSGQLDCIVKGTLAILRGEEDKADPEVREHFAGTVNILYPVTNPRPDPATSPIADRFIVGWRAAYVMSLLSIRRDHAAEIIDLFRRYYQKYPVAPEGQYGKMKMKDYLCQEPQVSLISGVMFYCLEALGRMRAPEAYDLCMDVLVKHPTDAAYGISQVYQLEPFLSPAPRYRVAAAYALGRLGRSDAIPALMKVVQDFDNVVEVRHWAARALGELCRPESAGELMKLADSYPEIHNRRTLQDAAAKAQRRTAVQE